MLPRYWPRQAPPPGRENDPGSTETWVACTGAGQPAYAIATQLLSQHERTRTGEVEMTPPTLLDLLVSALTEAGHDLPDGLARFFPRQDGMPVPLRAPTPAIAVIAAKETMANIAALDETTAFYTILDGCWIVGLIPADTSLVLDALPNGSSTD